MNRKKFVAPSFGHSGFTWPVKGEVIVEFGPAARGVYNDGVNILAESGRPVTVSANGTVAFVGNNIKNFGKLVLVKHDGGYMTAYAHLGEILVSEGDVLTTGDTIGSIGSTGRVDTPQLHFDYQLDYQNHYCLKHLQPYFHTRSLRSYRHHHLRLKRRILLRHYCHPL